MKARLEQFHLEIEPSKTKLISFGWYAEQEAKRSGRKPETFDFLGFTHYCGRTSRSGYFKVKRRTSKKKFRAKLKEVQEWLRRERCHQKKGALLQRAKLKLIGHLNYYAIIDNTRMCQLYKHQVTGLLFKWLNRQSQRRSYNWAQFHDALAWVGWPAVRIRHDINPFNRSAPNER